MKLNGDKCQCSSCGAYFGRSSIFAAHRVGPMSDRRCLSDTVMLGNGWWKDTEGFWRWPKPDNGFSRGDGE